MASVEGGAMSSPLWLMRTLTDPSDSFDVRKKAAENGYLTLTLTLTLTRTRSRSRSRSRSRTLRLRLTRPPRTATLPLLTAAARCAPTTTAWGLRVRA